jgi:DNA-binding GntR family transcriptional regulator
VNKQERTYTIIRDRIHVGSIAPLQRLNIDAIARELGVSPIPVREALRRLEAEGWVRFTPNVGAVVSPVDATSWEQAMVALAILEGAASGEATPHLRKSDLTRLRKIAASMEEAAAHADPRRFSRLNRSLHGVITARCPNTVLTEMLAQTNDRLDRLRSTMFVYLPNRSAEALGEHQHLIGLLEAGDSVAVEDYARWHKLRTVAAYRQAHPAGAGETLAVATEGRL